MPFHIDQLADTLPASGAKPYETWLAEATETLGGRIGNRDITALRRDERSRFYIDRASKTLMVSRSGGAE
jgi:hypothetical protein